MDFFSNEFASTLQYFTFPLEVVGLTLAAIELRYPAQARIITRVVAFQDRNTTIESFTNRWRNSSDFPTFRYRIGLLVVLLAISTIVALSITLSLIIFSTVVFLMIRLTNRWVPDRAVGTLGIIIASVGVLGDGYQFTAQLMSA